MVDNNIRDCGIKAFAEALEVNTTLNGLYLENQQGAFDETTNRYGTLNTVYDLVARNRINYEFSKNPSLSQLYLSSVNNNVFLICYCCIV